MFSIISFKESVGRKPPEEITVIAKLKLSRILMPDIKNKNKINLKFNLIFCDPPYKDRNIQKLITLIYNKDLLEKNGIIILHRNKTTIEKLPDNFELIDERYYGISKIIFGRLLA